ITAGSSLNGNSKLLMFCGSHLEPDVDVAGAARILVVRQRRTACAALPAAERAQHLQIVCTAGFPMRRAIGLVPLREDAVVPALVHVAQRRLVELDVAAAGH